MGTASQFDAGWKRRAAAGEAAAVQLMVRCAGPDLYRFCLYRLARNRHWCEEVVQETLVVALEKLDQYDPQRADGELLPWLTGLARNEIRRVQLREGRAESLDRVAVTVTSPELALLDREPLPDELLARDETRQLVNVTMSQLPARHREALEDKYLNRQSVREMAGARGLSEKATESLLTRARQAFRDAFLTIQRDPTAADVAQADTG